MINKSRSKLFNLFFIFTFLCTSSCTTIRPINETSPQGLVYELEVGDVVNVTTKRGKTYKFKITHITDEAIHGDGVRIAFEEVDSIDRKEFSAAKTGGLWAGLTIIGVLAGMLAMKAIFTPVFKLGF